MAKLIPQNREDTQEELLEAAQKMARKAADRDVKNHGDFGGKGGGSGLREDMREWLPLDSDEGSFNLPGKPPKPKASNR